MKPQPWWKRGAWCFIFLVGGIDASAHDLAASHATIRLKPGIVEVQIKIAADSAWPLVQETVAPGAIFVLEDFEKVGRPLLVAFARTMEELTVKSVPVPAQAIDVAVVEDNFIFTFSYARPAQQTASLSANYLKRTPPDYLFLAMIVDENEKPVTSAVLHGAVPAVTIVVPPSSSRPVSP